MENNWGLHQFLIWTSFRYCLGRRSYITSTCADFLLTNWDRIDPSNKKLIRQEIQEAIDQDLAGDSMDVEQWKRIL